MFNNSLLHKIQIKDIFLFNKIKIEDVVSESFGPQHHNHYHYYYHYYYYVGPVRLLLKTCFVQNLVWKSKLGVDNDNWLDSRCLDSRHKSPNKAKNMICLIWKAIITTFNKYLTQHRKRAWIIPDLDRTVLVSACVKY